MNTCPCGKLANETGLCDECAATVDQVAAVNDCIGTETPASKAGNILNKQQNN